MVQGGEQDFRQQMYAAYSKPQADVLLSCWLKKRVLRDSGFYALYSGLKTFETEHADLSDGGEKQRLVDQVQATAEYSNLKHLLEELQCTYASPEPNLRFPKMTVLQVRQEQTVKS